MCDTLVALGNSTTSGKVLFAKNSDRDDDEPAELVFVPRASHASGEMVKTTYISIPQVARTFDVLLCKPNWIWGAEMGANEYGVTIGNESIMTREPIVREEGLIGMDLLRLALERGKTARGALDVITQLLAQYGQGGNHGYTHPFFYHNSYLIADPTDAWVLETAGRFWIAEHVRDVRSISNSLSIHGKGDLRHPNLISHAIEKGWCPSEDAFDFASQYIPLPATQEAGIYGASCGDNRVGRSRELLAKVKGNIDEPLLMSILRDHGGAKDWNPGRDRTMKVICVHADGSLVANQTTNSLVSVLADGVQTHWVTGTSAPCTSIFKPVFYPGTWVPTENRVGKVYDPNSLWWMHEELHRLVLLDYPKRMPAYTKERDEMEAKFLAGTRELTDLARKNASSIAESTPRLIEFTKNAFNETTQAERRWIQTVRAIPAEQKFEAVYRMHWKKINKQNGMPEMT